MKSKKIKLSDVIIGIVSMVTGAAMALVVMDNEGNFVLQILSMFLYGAIAYILQTIIHEGGHLVCGLLSGYKFTSFRVGSWVLTKTDGKLVLKKFSIPGTAGQCLLDPPAFDEGRFPCTLYNAGGVLFNMLASLLCLGLSFLPIHIVLVKFLRCMCVIGIYMALTNGIPMMVGTIANDGYNILHLNRNITAKRGLWQQLKINNEASKGIRLKDMPEEWFETGDMREMDNGLAGSTLVSLYNRYLDAHEFAKAREVMNTIKENKIPLAGIYDTMMENDRVFLDIIDKGEEADASSLKEKPHSQVLAQLKTFPSVFRTQYAVAKVVEKDEAKAESIRKSFEKMAEKYPLPADIETERELMDLV